MSPQCYRKPPITEAVIEIRFAESIDAARLQKANADFALDYPVEQRLRNVGFELRVPRGHDDQPTAQLGQDEAGYRRASSDLSQIVLLWPASFALAQLAPYPGWDVFFGRFVREWATGKRASGYRKIARVGVRFINRLDVPLIGAVTEESHYLNVYPKLPDTLGSVLAYGIQAQLPLADVGCNLLLNSSSMPSPLLGHGSFLLDLDIFKEIEPPQKDDDIYDLLNAIRRKKNEVFEACVTNRARELFQT